VAPVTTVNGQLRIPLHVANASELNATQAYSGHLKILYPKLEDYEVRAPTQLRLRFQAAEAPEIYSVRPQDGSTVARGVPVTFVVQTLQDANVLWDFGDEQSKSGPEVQHTFNTASERTVTVTVRSSNGLSAEAKIELSVIDLAANIVPINSIVSENRPGEFMRANRGPIKRVEWMVDGHEYDPTDESNGSLKYTFDRPGVHTIQLFGYSDATPLIGKPMEINVVPGPRIEVTEDRLRPGQEIRLTLNSPPGVTKVDWEVDDEKNFDVGTELLRRFETRGTHRVTATVQWKDSQPVVVRRDIAIDGEFPAAKIDVGRTEPDAITNEARKFSLGETLPLFNSAKGDIRNQNWSVKRPDETEFSPIPLNTTTLPLNQLGPWSIRLETIGWPDSEGLIENDDDQIDLIVNPRPNRTLFALLAGLVAILWLYLGYVLVIGNQPRHWWLYFQFGSIPEASKMIPFKLNRKGIWSWRYKRARVPMNRFTSNGYWVENGRHECIQISKTRGADGPVAHIDYSGESTTGIRQGKITALIEDATERQLKIEESRMPADRQTLYLIVKKKPGSELMPWFLFVLCTAILVSIVAALDRSIFGV